ncbi:MAG: serine/threonine protein kinase [Magnetococcales bacterium]|nr:serine/threonine protein kinase [Magnetococcales bacterium]
MNMTASEDKTPYLNLGPDAILDAVESVGYHCDGHQLALNSYENRVYQVGMEDGQFLVAKFYRAGRWSDEAILEEHLFSTALYEQEIPAVPPIADAEGRTLHSHGGYRFSLYPRRGGRAPDLELPENLRHMGRLLGRIHAMGGVRPFSHRPTLDLESFGVASRAFLLESNMIPLELERAYETLTSDLIERIGICFDQAGNTRQIRLHGDCHPGNILWTDDGPHFVDFDDARMGPAVQDLWMCLSGGREDQIAQLDHLLSGYTLFCDFDIRELRLVEALRTLRMMHHAAWIARRWDDPAFPLAFPWFNGPRYWDEHVLALREQAALMDEFPLTWDK